MFILKFALELTVLVFLFLMIRKTIFRTLPVLSSEDEELASAKWRNQRYVYSGIFLIFGFIASVTTFWVIYFSFNIFHSIGNYSGVLVISQGAIILPSLIIGFYISTIFSKNVYVHLLGMQEYISFDDLYGKKGRVGKVFLRVFSALTLTPAIVLLSLQFNVYLKTDGENIYTKQLLEAEKVYSIREIVGVGASESNYLNIYLANGDQISTMGYSGNLNYFLENISKR